MPDARLERQVAFLVEADKLKSILRRTPLVDASRLENSAEHSWHLVLVAMIMREYTTGPIDLMHVIEMVTVHDLVEIDAGDTFAYDAAGLSTKIARELAAAGRIFGLLPDDQRDYVRNLWEEFEAHAGGGSWRTHNLSRDQIMNRMAPIESAMPALWPLVVQVIDSFCAAGLIDRSV
jgi:putative hydrolase of HD superfamily